VGDVPVQRHERDAVRRLDASTTAAAIATAASSSEHQVRDQRHRQRGGVQGRARATAAIAAELVKPVSSARGA